MTSHLPTKRQPQVRFTVHGNNGSSSPPRNYDGNSNLPTDQYSNMSAAVSAGNEPPLISSRYNDPNIALAHAESLQNISSSSTLPYYGNNNNNQNQNEITLSGVSPVVGRNHQQQQQQQSNFADGDDNNDGADHQEEDQNNNNNIDSRRSSLSSTEVINQNVTINNQNKRQNNTNHQQPTPINISNAGSRKSSNMTNALLTIGSSNNNNNNHVRSMSGSFAADSDGGGDLFSASGGMTGNNNNNNSSRERSTIQEKQISHLQQQLQLLTQERDLYRNECFTMQKRNQDLGMAFDNQRNELYRAKQEIAAIKQKITEAVSAESMRIAQEQVWNDRIRHANHGGMMNHEEDEMEIKLRALKEETLALQQQNSASMKLAPTNNPYTAMKQKYELEIQQLKDQLSRDTKLTEEMRKDMSVVVSLFYSGLREMEIAVGAAADGARFPPGFSPKFTTILQDNSKMGLAEAALRPGFFQSQLDRINQAKNAEKLAAAQSFTRGKPIAFFDPKVIHQQQMAVLSTHSRYTPEYAPPLGCKHTIVAYVDEINAAINRCFVKVSANVMSVGQDAASIREMLGGTAAKIVDEIRFGIIPQNLFTRDFVQGVQEMADRALREVEFVCETQYGTTIPKLLSDVTEGDTIRELVSEKDEQKKNQSFQKNQANFSAANGVITTPSRPTTTKLRRKSAQEMMDRVKNENMRKSQRSSSSSSSSSTSSSSSSPSSSSSSNSSVDRKKRRKHRKTTSRKGKQQKLDKITQNTNNINNSNNNILAPNSKNNFTTTSTTATAAPPGNNRSPHFIQGPSSSLTPQALFDPEASFVSQLSDVNCTPHLQHQQQQQHHHHHSIGYPPLQQQQTAANASINNNNAVRPSIPQQQQQQAPTPVSHTTNTTMTSLSGSPSGGSPRPARRGEGISPRGVDRNSLASQQPFINNNSNNINNNSQNTNTVPSFEQRIFDRDSFHSSHRSRRSSSGSNSSSTSSESSGRHRSSRKRRDKKSKKSKSKHHRRSSSKGKEKQKKSKSDSKFMDSSASTTTAVPYLQFTKEEAERDLGFIIEHLRRRPLNLTMGSPESLSHICGSLTNMTLLLHNNLKVYEDNKALVDKLLTDFYQAVKNMVHVPKRMTSANASEIAGDDDNNNDHDE